VLGESVMGLPSKHPEELREGAVRMVVEIRPRTRLKTINPECQPNRGQTPMIHRFVDHADFQYSREHEPRTRHNDQHQSGLV